MSYTERNPLQPFTIEESLKIECVELAIKASDATSMPVVSLAKEIYEFVKTPKTDENPVL